MSAVTALLAIEVAAGIPLRSSPDVVMAAAITIDVAVGLPLIGWLFLVRRRGMSPVILAPLFLLGVFAAGAVVPDNVDRPVEVARRLLPVIEGVVVIAMALKVRHRATMKRADQFLWFDRLRAALTDVLGPGHATRVVATEIGLLGLAVIGWRMQPPTVPTFSRPIAVVA